MQGHRAVGQVHRLPAPAHLGVQRRARHHDGTEIGDGVVHAEARAVPEPRRTTPTAWSRSLDPGGSIVTSSTSVASTRSGPAAGRAAAAAAASASTAAGKPSGQARTRRAPRAKSGRGHSHRRQRRAAASPRRSQVTPLRPAEQPRHELRGGPPYLERPPVRSRGHLPHRPRPRLVGGYEQQPRELRAGAHRLGGIGEELAQHRPGQVGERGAGVEVDGVDPHLAGPQPQHVRGQDPAAPEVHARRPGLLRHLADRRGEPVRRRDEVGADLRGRALGARLDVRVALLGAGVGRGRDAGAGPGQQVDQRVGVAGDVGQHVRPGPVRQRRRLGERLVTHPGQHPPQVGGAVGGPGQRLLLVGVTTVSPRRRSPPGTCCGSCRSPRSRSTIVAPSVR